MNLMTECFTPLSLLMNWFQHSPQCTEVYQTSIVTDASGFWGYLGIFGMTFLTELPIYFLFLYRYSSFLRILLINFILNIATHPVVFLLMPWLFQKWDLSYLQYILIAEFFAPAIEALILRKLFKMDWSAAIAAALIANLFSWTVGVYWTS